MKQSKCLEILSYYNQLGQHTISPEYLSTIKYSIKDPEKFAKLQISDIQRTYWIEILQRSHWAAISSIQRNLKWMDGISLSISNSNMLLFSASLRGFIEASADSMTALVYVPLSLAEHFGRIQNALNGNTTGNEVLIIPELEEILIHFAFAKGHSKEERKNQQIESSHIAKTNTEYIKVLDQNIANGPVYQLYSFLCQFTHPAANTIFYSIQQTYADLESEFSYIEGDDKAIVKALSQFDTAISDACQYSFNAAFVLLKTLNEFDHQMTFTPFATGFTFEDTVAWQKVKNKIDEQSSSKS